jgi:predicted MFS family arabinose efflux permease
VVAAANMVGNLTAGRLLQRGWRATHLLACGYLAMGLGALATFGLGMPANAQYVAVFGFSLLGGLIPATLFSLAVKLSPDEGSVSSTVGFMQQLSCLGQFFGPPLVGFLASAVGGWRWTWVATGLCSLLGLVLVRVLGQILYSRSDSSLSN